MVPTPIPAYLVHIVFQYILPPSLPLPPHLLSKRLTERHHYLSISPTDAASYLCWPSADAVKVTEALEHGIPSTFASGPEHDVRYTAPDKETVLAHVRPNAQSPLQIVFVWDVETVTWRYHDARMLPFPEASRPSLDVVLAIRQKTTSELEPPFRIIDQPSPTRSASPASDKYWAGYESSGSSPDTSALPSSVPIGEDEKTEAAYWASYSAVHGSGDSTMPSPRLERRRLAQNHKPFDARGPETTFDPLVAHLHLRLQRERAIDPSLSRNDTGSRVAAYEDTPIGEDCQRTTSVQLEHNQQMQDDDYDDYGFTNDGGLNVVEPSALQMTRVKDMNTQDTGENARDGREDGLREAIRGIYRMWKAQSGSKDPGIFIDIVKDTLEM